MGRKGMKGFVKSAAKRPGPDEEEEEPQQKEPETERPQQQKVAQPKQLAKVAPSKPAAAKQEGVASDGGGSGSDDGEGEDGQQTRNHILQRHKREMLAHKKALQRSGKKSKDEVTRLTADIEKRHAQELAAFDAAGSGGSSSAAAANGGGAGGAADASSGSRGGAAAPPGAGEAVTGGGAEPLSKYLKGLTVDSAEAAAQARRPSKAQKRREKHAAKDAEREARVAAEKEALGTPERLAEEAALKAVLAPLGLGIKEIRADGHCMYRSVEDQLRATARAAKAKAAAGVEGSSVNVGEHGDGDQGEGEGEEEEEVPDYQELRELAAEHLRSHRGEFAPYLVPEDEGEDPEAYFERYCDAVETTATWGGHVELQALSGALGRRITVFAVGMQPQVLGEGKGADEGLTLCFLRHAYGLGEHYNSTKKLLFAPGEVVAEVAAGGDDK